MPFFTYLSGKAARALGNLGVGDGATVSDVLREIPGQTIQTGKDIGQSIAREFAAAKPLAVKSVTSSPFLPFLSQDAVKKTGAYEPVTPKSKVSQAIFGTDEAITFESVGRELPFTENLSPRAASMLGFGMFALDVTPFKSTSVIAKRIAKETAPDVITQLVKKEAPQLADDAIEAMIPNLVKANTPKKVELVFKAIPTKPSTISTRLAAKEQPLLQEAKKYKTADEFVEKNIDNYVKTTKEYKDWAKGNKNIIEAYHGTPYSFDKFEIGKKQSGAYELYGISFATEKNLAEPFSRQFPDSYYDKKGILDKKFPKVSETKSNLDKIEVQSKKRGIDSINKEGKEVSDTLKERLQKREDMIKDFFGRRLNQDDLAKFKEENSYSYGRLRELEAELKASKNKQDIDVSLSDKKDLKTYNKELKKLEDEVQGNIYKVHIKGKKIIDEIGEDIGFSGNRNSIVAELDGDILRIKDADTGQYIGEEIIVNNPEQVFIIDSAKTKSQLTDIWNKATQAKQVEKQIPQKTARQIEKSSNTQVGLPDSTVVSDSASLPSTVTKKKTKVISGTPEQKVKTNIAEPERADNIRNILNKTEMRIRPTGKVGDLTKRNLVAEIKATAKKQGEKIKDSEIRKIREQNLLGAETIDEIILRKRGIITDKEAIERAKVMQGTLDDVLSIPKGSVPNKEQMTAISQIVQQEREVNKKLGQLLDGFGSTSSKEERALIKKLAGDEKISDEEAIIRALEESTRKLRKAEIVLFAAKSEAGRALQSAKMTVGAVDSRMRIAFGKMKKLNDLERQAAIEQLADIHLNNDKEFIKFLDELQNADFFDKFAEWSTAAKLWNPTTHVVNFGGNTIRQLFDMGITAIVSPRTAKADIMGAKKGLNIGLKNAARALSDEGYASTLSKYIEEGGSAPAIGGKLGKWARTPFRALGAGDEVFRAMGYQRTLYRQASRIAKGNSKKMEEILSRPTLDMMEEATKQSKRLTFQEDMGEIVKFINKGRTPSNFKSKTAKSLSTLMRLFVPFLKTPNNLFKQAVDLSPLGVIKNFDEIKKVAKKGENEHALRLLGEAVVGTALMAWVAQETLDGNITGGSPRNKAEADKFYRENKLPYAIKIGDKWWQYKRVDPFSTVIGLSSDLTTLSKEEDLEVGSVIDILSKQLEDKTFMRGINDLLKLVSGEPWERDYALKSAVLGAGLPSFVGHAARSVDPQIRVAKSITDRIKSQIPFVSKSLPVKVNVLGQDIERANKGLNYFFNPIQSDTAEIDPITKHLMEINKTIALPSDYFSRDGIKYELTPDEYESYSKKVGNELASEIEKLMRSPQYQRLSDEKKEKKIDKLRSDIQGEWKDDYVKGREAPITRDELKVILLEQLESGQITRAEVERKIKTYDARY